MRAAFSPVPDAAGITACQKLLVFSEASVLRSITHRGGCRSQTWPGPWSALPAACACFPDLASPRPPCTSEFLWAGSPETPTNTPAAREEGLESHTRAARGTCVARAPGPADRCGVCYWTKTLGGGGFLSSLAFLVVSHSGWRAMR